jgi:ribonuclease Z
MLLGRTADLHIYGPKGIKEIITLQLRLSGSWTTYGLFFHELDSTESEIVFEDEKVIVQSFPLKHRIYTNGFLFREKVGDRKLNIVAVEKYKIDTAYFRKIKNGKDITLDDGRTIANGMLTYEPIPPKSYAFCSDTVYTESIVPYIKDVDVLYHESTFLESEKALGLKTMHSTAIEAATIALKGNVKQLLLGHYSTRYGNIELFREEAQTVFPNVLLADDGKTFEF